MIPTAKEFVINTNDGYLAGDYTPNEVYDMMIEFAKMHVKAALGAADREVPLPYSEGVLNCYSLEKIK